MATTHRMLVALALLAAIAGGLTLLASRDGVSTTPDDSVYVGVTRSLVHGHGLDAPIHMYPLGTVSIGTPPPGRSEPKPTPMVHYSPLQPVVLAIGGDHPLGTARIEDAIFMAVSAFLAGLIVFRATGVLWPAAATELIIGFFLAVGPVSSTGTEGLALLLAVAVFALVLRHLERPRAIWLLAAAVLIGLATLERYAAGGLIVWAVIALRHRRRDALVLFLVSSAPLVAWFAYERASGASTGHQLALHIVTNTARAGGRSLADWILPSTTPLPIAILGAAIVVVLVVAVVGRSRMSAPRLLLLFAGVQIVALLVAVTFFDAAVDLVPREFIPMFVAVVIAMACVLGQKPSARPAVMLVTALYVVAGIVVLVHPAKVYAEQSWATSPLMADVRALPTSTVIYTNAPDAIYLVGGRAVSSIPETKDFSTLKTNAKFDDQLREIRTTLASRGGYVVYFRGFDRDDFLPTEAELQHLLALHRVRNERDGAIYSITASP